MKTSCDCPHDTSLELGISSSHDFSAQELSVRERYLEEAENGHKAALVTPL